MLGDAFKAVFWSFFGVRKGEDYAADSRKLKPQHVIAAGIVSAFVFVMVLFAIVKLVIREKPAAAPATKACPECLETLPAAARRCRACTSTV